MKLPRNPVALKKKYVVSLDPGGTTGFCILEIDYDEKVIIVKKLGEFQTWSKLLSIINTFDSYETNLVYEGFTLRLLSANLIPVEVIGVIKYLFLANGFSIFVQEPGERYAAERWYDLDSFTSHYGSALRHGLVFAVTNLCGHVPWKIRIAKDILHHIDSNIELLET